MKKRNSVIKIYELPQRHQNLAIDDVKEIFGGCTSYHQPCSTDCECCLKGGASYMICDRDPYNNEKICYAVYITSHTE